MSENTQTSFIQDDYTCVKCNASDVNLEVHHIIYDNLGLANVVEAFDCVSLCRDCHEAVHQKHGYRNEQNYYPID